MSRRPPLSLALRLTLLFGVVATVVFAGFGWLVEDAIRRHFAEEDRSELITIAEAVERVLDEAPAHGATPSLARRFEDILVGHHGASLRVSDATGRLWFASRGPDLAVLDVAILASGSIREWQQNGHRYRVLVRHLPRGAGYRLVAAVPIDHHQRFLGQFRRTLWGLIAASIVLTSVLGGFAVRQGLVPLRRIVARIRRIRVRDLGTRLEPDELPAELRELVGSFNALLERVEAGFRRLSDFAADMAHDLRTPITNMMTQTQVALAQQRSVDEYREILYSNIEEFENLRQMINDMLFLAQADKCLQPPHPEPVDLRREVQDLFDYYEAWAEERAVGLNLTGEGRIVGDRLMLRRALSNLLSNAIRHTPEGETVQVRLQSEDGDVVVTVENPGPAIPAQHLPHLFERFYRVDSARQDGGTGLGLAIVKSIAEAHDGSVTVESQAGVTRFGLRLPRHDSARQVRIE